MQNDRLLCGAVVLLATFSLPIPGHASDSFGRRALPYFSAFTVQKAFSPSSLLLTQGVAASVHPLGGHRRAAFMAAPYITTSSLNYAKSQQIASLGISIKTTARQFPHKGTA